MMYICRPCKATIGTHKDSKNNHPLGSLANEKLKKLRIRCHALIDPLWKTKKMKRKEVYLLLFEKTGVKHIGWAREKDCRRIIKYFEENYDTKIKG